MKVNGFELSPQQKYLWHLQQGDSFNYSVVGAVSITGNLQIDVLKSAVNQVIKNHEILRTNYQDVTEMNFPLQVINNQGLFLYEEYDLSSCNFQEQEDKLQQIFNGFLNLNFNLETGAVLNLSLVNITANKYILLMALPAICGDKATLQNLVKLISESYAAISQQEDILDDEVLQYADLSAWQNELLTGVETQAGREYWSNLDFSALTALHLPGEKTANLEFKPESYSCKLDLELTNKINSYLQFNDISLSEFLLTCWNILLWKLTGQDNLIIGFVSECRKYQELESALGLLSKTLPISVYIQGTDNFLEICEQIQIKLVEAFSYEEYFLLDKETNFLPFTFELEAELVNYHSDEIEFSIYQQAVYTDRYKIKLSGYDQNNSLELKLSYDSNLFSSDHIQQLLKQFCTLLESAITFPDLPISQLQILDQTEKQKLLREFNNTQVNYNYYQCIHQLFSERAINTPDKIALIFENETFTYAQLNNRANQIARYLQKLGVGSDILVGLCVDRSPLMVLGILAILKAGSAYVPLDPTYPQERLAFMLENSQPKVLLTQSHIKLELPTDKIQVVYIDKIDNFINEESPENLTDTSYPQSLAYVIYTSGSTGKPKGVRVTHANLCHYVQAMQKALDITADDVYLHTASLAFSSSVRQLLVPLTRGASVKIATQEQRQDPLALFQGIKQDQVTVIDIVPSYWRNCNYILASLASDLKNYLLDNQLRLIVSASEPLLSDVPVTWKFDLQHQSCLINMFGQTETCGIVATYPINIEADTPTKIIPLGKPIANTQIYILDQYLEPLPMGVTGELYIGGWGVGQGYLHRPDLTAERFIPDPFSYEPGVRLYKTGDLGRYLPDGKIEFIGRSDYQVKIRGFRIELAEIEAVLTQYSQIREAVVIARENENGDKSLVAYLVAHQTTNLKSSDLNNFLKNRLPDYMLPSRFVLLEALPLTPNGKVNRNLLPTLQQGRDNLETNFVAPRNQIEEVIAGIWQELLSVQKIGIYDNFFDLGGHSLLATQVIYKMREALQTELPLRSLFDSPTVAAIAERIANTQEQIDGIFHLSIAPNLEERYQPFPLTDIQQAYWIGRNEAFDLSNVATHAYREIDCLNLDLERFNTAWQRLIERHDMLRAIVQPNGQQQILSQVPAYEIKVLDLRGENEEIREFRLAEIRNRMSHQVLPADKWPLFEICATRLPENKIRLCLSFDLLIGDAWSYQIIGRELAELMQNNDSPLSPIEISFRDYVLGEIALRNTELYSRALEYWQSRIVTLPPSPELPLAKNLVAINNPRFHRRTGKLAADAWLKLQNKAQQIDVTPSIILLAAYAEILTVWSKKPQFTINLTLFNRLPLHPQINQIVGDFTTLNLLEVTNLEVNSFTVRAQGIQQQLWDDLDHRYVSGVQVLRELVQTQERSLGAIMPVVFTSTCISRCSE